MGNKGLVQCTHCGWVHFPISQKDAEAEVKRFNEFYHTLDAEGQAAYGGKPSSVDSYLNCDRCGKLADMTREVTNFREGSTIGPIIWEKP